MWHPDGSSPNYPEAAPAARKGAKAPGHSRNARACAGCKKVKSKCEELPDAHGAACRRCQRLGLECIFMDAPAHRRNPSADASASPLMAHAAATTGAAATKKRRGEDEVYGVAYSAAYGAGALVVNAAPPLVLMRDWDLADAYKPAPGQPEYPPKDSFGREFVEQQFEPAPPPRPPPVATAAVYRVEECEDELAKALEARCSFATGSAQSVPCQLGRALPLQAASLPPAVAGFVAYEEARTDLPPPLIFMRNCLNSDFCFMVNQEFQDRVSSIANFTPPLPGQCPGMKSGAFVGEDMKKMNELVEVSSQGLYAPSPTGGIIERSIKLEVPYPVRIRVRPHGVRPPPPGASDDAQPPFVPCHMAIQVNLAVGPGLQAVQVTFVARPVHEVAAHASSRPSRWFPAWALAPGSVAAAAAAAVAALVPKSSRSSAPRPAPMLIPEAAAASEAVPPAASPDTGGHDGQPDGQQPDGELDCDDAAAMNESFMDDAFASLLDSAGPLSPLGDVFAAASEKWA